MYVGKLEVTKVVPLVQNGKKNLPSISSPLNKGSKYTIRTRFPMKTARVPSFSQDPGTQHSDLCSFLHLKRVYPLSLSLSVSLCLSLSLSVSLSVIVFSLSSLLTYSYFACLSVCLSLSLSLSLSCHDY